MRKCLIVGAGGQGREVLSWALHVPNPDWTIAGFLDANPKALEGKNVSYSVLGSPDTWVPAQDEVFLAAIGVPEVRLRVCGALAAKGATFLTLVHPTAVLGLNHTLGEGTIVAPLAVISANASVGRFGLVNVGAYVAHDSRVGEATTIGPRADVLGGVTVGKCTYIGSHGCLLPGSTVGDGCMVGAGAVVLRNVESGTTVAGVPAHPLPRK